MVKYTFILSDGSTLDPMSITETSRAIMAFTHGNVRTIVVGPSMPGVSEIFHPESSLSVLASKLAVAEKLPAKSKSPLGISFETHFPIYSEDDSKKYATGLVGFLKKHGYYVAVLRPANLPVPAPNDLKWLRDIFSASESRTLGFSKINAKEYDVGKFIVGNKYTNEYIRVQTMTYINEVKYHILHRTTTMTIKELKNVKFPNTKEYSGLAELTADADEDDTFDDYVTKKYNCMPIEINFTEISDMQAKFTTDGERSTLTFKFSEKFLDIAFIKWIAEGCVNNYKSNLFTVAIEDKLFPEPGFDLDETIPEFAAEVRKTVDSKDQSAFVLHDTGLRKVMVVVNKDVSVSEFRHSLEPSIQQWMKNENYSDIVLQFYGGKVKRGETGVNFIQMPAYRSFSKLPKVHPIAQLPLLSVERETEYEREQSEQKRLRREWLEAPEEQLPYIIGEPFSLTAIHGYNTIAIELQERIRVILHNIAKKRVFYQYKVKIEGVDAEEYTGTSHSLTLELSPMNIGHVQRILAYSFDDRNSEREFADFLQNLYDHGVKVKRSVSGPSELYSIDNITIDGEEIRDIKKYFEDKYNSDEWLFPVHPKAILIIGEVENESYMFYETDEKKLVYDGSGIISRNTVSRFEEEVKRFIDEELVDNYCYKRHAKDIKVYVKLDLQTIRILDGKTTVQYKIFIVNTNRNKSFFSLFPKNGIRQLAFYLAKIECFDFFQDYEGEEENEEKIKVALMKNLVIIDEADGRPSAGYIVYDRKFDLENRHVSLEERVSKTVTSLVKARNAIEGEDFQ